MRINKAYIMSAHRVIGTISQSTPADRFCVGSIVRWNRTEEQLWVLVFVQKPLYIIRTLPFEDGSFATRTISGHENLTMVQSGNTLIKSVSGIASKFSKENLPQ